MPYNEQLAERIRKTLKNHKGIFERKMFGGICFMKNGNMACGIERDRLMVRVGPQKYETCLKMPHARVMDFTGRPLKGFIFVSEEGYKTPASLRKWVGLGVKFTQSLPAK